MIRNNFSDEERNKRAHYFTHNYETFGFAFNNSELLNDSFVQIEAHVRHKNLTSSQIPFFDCNESVYSQLSKRMSNEVPSDLKIKCMRVPIQDVNMGSYPSFKISKCVNKKGEKDCAPVEVIDKKLEQVKIWVFSLADERDFSKNVKTEELTFTAS